MMSYQDINAKAIDSWVKEGWEWGIAIDRSVYEAAKNGIWNVKLTPTKYVPLKNPEQMKQLEQEDGGVQFSHTLEEQLGGQLEAGFRLTDLYEDTNGSGRLHQMNIPCYIATRAVK